MKQKRLTPLLLSLLAFLISNTALAGTYEWTSGWGMGVSEYLVDDGNGNALNISCPDDEERYVSAYATIFGKSYSSHRDTGFDVIVDGEVYSNPFYSECTVCAAIFQDFWSALLKANNLQIRAEGKTAKLPTKNLNNLLLPLDNPKNTCRSGW